MRIFWRVIAVLVLVAAVIGVGVYAYSIGLNSGLAQKVTTQGGTPALPVAPYPYYWHPFFGFGFLGCLVPFFLLFLILGATRALFWHGPMGWRRHYWRHHGPWGYREGEGEDKGVPPFFEEWHKRAHGEPPSNQEKQ